MKLSEAGLLGGIATRQCQTRLLTKGNTCFLGGALVAIGAIDASVPLTDEQECNAYNTLKVTWPILIQKAINPESGELDTVMCIIWWLNDTSSWTRPQIAAWVASIEPQETLVEQTINQEVYCEVK